MVRFLKIKDIGSVQDQETSHLKFGMENYNQEKITEDLWGITDCSHPVTQVILPISERFLRRQLARASLALGGGRFDAAGALWQMSGMGIDDVVGKSSIFYWGYAL